MCCVVRQLGCNEISVCVCHAELLAARAKFCHQHLCEALSAGKDVEGKAARVCHGKWLQL